MEFDYSQFGPAGPMYQQYYYSLWCSLRDHWNALGERREQQTFEEVIGSFTRGDLWWTAFTMMKDALPEEQLLELWARFSQIFSPALATDLQSDAPIATQKCELQMLLATLSSNPVSLFTRQGLNEFCEGGPFSSEEMSFLLGNHPRMVQMAAGTGYLALIFAMLRGDFIGVDNYEYGDMFTADHWVSRLFKANRLRTGGSQSLAEFADRTLLISWPEPRSAIPIDALQAYSAAGGKHFAFKLGGFCGIKLRSESELLSPSATPLSIPVPQGPERLVQFFMELAGNWVESTNPKRPPFRPEQFENALWMFERRQ